jgi:hypothetical protein
MQAIARRKRISGESMYSQKDREEAHSIAEEIASYGSMSTEGSLHKMYAIDRKAAASREGIAADRILSLLSLRKTANRPGAAPSHDRFSAICEAVESAYASAFGTGADGRSLSPFSLEPADPVKLDDAREKAAEAGLPHAAFDALCMLLLADDSRWYEPTVESVADDLVHMPYAFATASQGDFDFGHGRPNSVETSVAKWFEGPEYWLNDGVLNVIAYRNGQIKKARLPPFFSPRFAISELSRMGCRLPECDAESADRIRRSYSIFACYLHPAPRTAVMSIVDIAGFEIGTSPAVVDALLDALDSCEMVSRCFPALVKVAEHAICGAPQDEIDSIEQCNVMFEARSYSNRKGALDSDDLQEYAVSLAFKAARECGMDSMIDSYKAGVPLEDLLM